MTETSPYTPDNSDFPDPNSIRRIALKESAIVELLRVESPSSLFVRPIDHIRNQLVYKEPYSLTPITSIDVGVYALAPIEERVFGRCIIVRNIELLEACRVFFIDEAVTANVSWKCLFRIEESQMFHPWQAMHITLGRMISLTNEWSLEQCRNFSEILSDFPKFQITPSQVDLEDDSDRPSILVNLYGLQDNQDVNQKVAIEDICSVSMQDVLVTIFPSCLTDDPKLADLDKEQDDLEVILLEEFRRDLPYDWMHETPPDWVDGDENWDIEKCKVNEWNSSFLKPYLLENGCFWGFIKPNATVSPWKMYITPIIVEEEKNMSNEEWITEQFSQKLEMQRQFDDFYSIPQNQRPLEIDEIKFALTSGRAYAIAAVQHRKKTGRQWLRVEILDVLPNNNLEVRFIDQGIHGFQVLKSIHSIHSSHTKHPPFVIEMGQFFNDSVSDTDMEWGNEHWRYIVPYDIPVVFGPKLDFVETGKLLFAEVRNIDEEENLLDDIPPQPVFTDQSHDSRSWNEFSNEKKGENWELREMDEEDIDSYISA
ncbi:CBN-ERI-5 protein [Caenorhabditis brenneri]|uniref:CBN-ERI-5 protein n=1 Tax=Caenorhabditis brenneri TaxID=135651 RepID=G0MZZ5_CAEBE|nr:CBN-ERI-5 protein [Caenorhabditis brenneri]